MVMGKLKMFQIYLLQQTINYFKKDFRNIVNRDLADAIWNILNIALWTFIFVY